MRGLKVSDHLTANYEDFNQEIDLEWSRICASGKVDNIVLLCNDLPHHSILEIGSGDGSILQRLAEIDFGEQLFALEISRSGVELTKNRNISQLIECSTFDGYHIHYDDESFDIAVLSHVVEHVEHPRQLLYEASRVARYLLIEVPLEDTIRLPGDFTLNQIGHINFYSRKTIRLLLQSCDLRVLQQITKNRSRETYTYQKGNRGVIHYYIKQVFLNILPSIATKIFTYHAVLLCERIRK